MVAPQSVETPKKIAEAGTLTAGVVSMGRNYTEGNVHLVSNYWGLKRLFDDAPLPEEVLVFGFVNTASRRYSEVGQGSPRFLDAERAWLQAQSQAGRIKYFEYDIAGQKPEDIESALGEADVIFMGGGNTAYLQQELQDTGAGQVIRDLVRSGVWYLGKSAGAIVAGPDINPRGFFLDSMATRTITDTTGLNLTQVYPFPHVDTPKIMNVLCHDNKTGWQIAVEMTHKKPTAYIFDDKDAKPAAPIHFDSPTAYQPEANI